MHHLSSCIPWLFSIYALLASAITEPTNATAGFDLFPFNRNPAGLGHHVQAASNHAMAPIDFTLDGLGTFDSSQAQSSEVPHPWPSLHDAFRLTQRGRATHAGRTDNKILRKKAYGGMYTLADRWSGENFFDGWTFFEDADPTRGLVNFVSQSTAAANGLAYVEPDGKVVMKVDSSSNLPLGARRNSVRITTTKAYNHGLFVLDATKFPYGCAVWPAFWMFGPDWPWSGEMDIYETINLAPSTQYTAHTSAGCMIDTNTSSLAGVSLTANLDYQVPSSNAYVAKQGGGALGTSGDCGPSPSNSGCSWVDRNQAGGTPASIGGGSYAGMLTAQGGAVLVMQWEADGIRIWNFPRTHLPKDLSLGLPTPELWPNTFLKAAWDSSTACNVDHYFRNMSLVFDITLCGDWAGQPNVYTSSGCSGSCVTQVMKGSNFINATWELNYVAVYTRAH